MFTSLFLGIGEGQPSDFSVTKCILAAEDGSNDQQPGQLLEKSANNGSTNNNNVVSLVVKPDVPGALSGKEFHNYIILILI